MHAQEITFYHAVIIAFLVFGLVCGCFIFVMFRQHRRNIELYKAKLGAEITTLETERQRIANDLHDDLGPLLSAIKFNIGGIETNTEDEQLVKVAEKYLDDVVQKLRQISNDLMPVTLTRKGLTYAIEEFMEKVKGSSHLKIQFSYPEMPTLPDETNINLYRVLLEIIHNALKHSNADVLSIALQISKNDISIETKDNGTGFNVSKTIQHNTGRGLSNILNRTELMGGELFIESAPNAGTSYSITIPYQ